MIIINLGHKKNPHYCGYYSSSSLKKSSKNSSSLIILSSIILLDPSTFIFGVLFYLIKTDKIKQEGNLTLIYLILYSIVRIIVESIRLDSVRYVFGMPVAIFMSVCIIIVSIIVLAKRKGLL